MEFIEPEGPQAENVIDYDFIFIGKIGAQITIWPDRGDTAVYNPVDRQWEFAFPRSGREETVCREHLLNVAWVKGRRVYTDPETLMKNLKDRQEREKRERQEQRTRG